MITDNSTSTKEIDLTPKVILSVFTILAISIARAIDRSGAIKEFKFSSSGCEVKFKD